MNIKTLFRQSLASCLITGTIALASTSSAASALTNLEDTAPPFSAGRSFSMAQTVSLSGTWKLANMTAGDLPTPMLPTTEQTADFADGRITGLGGCNRFMGSYETQAGQLSISSLASTFMACEPDVMTQESTYLAALQGAQRYEVNPQGLTIFYQTEQGSGVLRFVSQAASEPAAEPVRGLW